MGNLGKLNNNGSVGQSVGNNGCSASIQSLGQEIKKNQQMAVIDALDFGSTTGSIDTVEYEQVPSLTEFEMDEAQLKNDNLMKTTII